MAREKTADEVRDEFLEHVRAMAGYWAGEGGSNVPVERSTRERLDGLAFSILVAIDGCAMGMPGFVLAPAPHPDDRAFSEGEDWYPEAPEAACDIAGGLHELYHGQARDGG